MTDHELQELSEDRCWELLAGETVGRLAVSVANKPDIFPVNYRLHDGTIVVKTAPGLKLAAAVLGAGVAFEIDALDAADRSGWSVVVHGTAQKIELLEDLLDADDLAIEPWAAGTKNHYFRIEPTEVTGRLIPSTGTA